MSKMPSDLPRLSQPSVDESSIIFDEFIKVRRDRLRLPDGTFYNYYSLVAHSAVSILAIAPNGRFVLTAEYRHPTGQMLLGAPGGYLGKDEDPLIGAERELLEETGYRAERFTLLGAAYPYPGISGQRIYYVLAPGAYKASTPQLEPAEILEPLEKTEEELQAIISSGIGIDGILLSGLYLYKHSTMSST